MPQIVRIGKLMNTVARTVAVVIGGVTGYWSNDAQTDAYYSNDAKTDKYQSND